MTMLLVIGIDPGITGGLAAIADGVLVKLRDMPTTTQVKRKRSKKTGEMRDAKKRRVNGYGISNFVREAVQEHPGAMVIAYLELASTRPGQNAAATMSTATSFGIAEGVLCGHGISVHHVAPHAWKRFYKMPKGASKDDSRALAVEKYANAAEHLAKAKDDGRAEAILIADYGFTKQSE